MVTSHKFTKQVFQMKCVGTNYKDSSLHKLRTLSTRVTLVQMSIMEVIQITTVLIPLHVIDHNNLQIMLTDLLILSSRFAEPSGSIHTVLPLSPCGQELQHSPVGACPPVRWAWLSQTPYQRAHVSTEAWKSPQPTSSHKQEVAA